MYTHLSATLDGISTIRSFNLCEKMFCDFLECVDYQAEAYVMFLDATRWFGQRVDFLAVVLNCFAILLPVISARYGGKLEI